MKPIKIIGYLLVIAALEGAVQEYLRMTASHAKEDPYYYGDYHNPVRKDDRKKESTHSWYEIVLAIMQSLWAMLVRTVQSMWHAIREWVELVLIVFECSELVHKLAGRFNLWGGLQ